MILESTWEDADTAAYFDVSYEPLSKEEVKKEKGASCGLLAKVTVKPGLPLGPINQTIHIKSERGQRGRRGHSRERAGVVRHPNCLVA